MMKGMSVAARSSPDCSICPGCRGCLSAPLFVSDFRGNVQRGSQAWLPRALYTRGPADRILYRVETYLGSSFANPFQTLPPLGEMIAFPSSASLSSKVAYKGFFALASSA